MDSALLLYARCHSTKTRPLVGVSDIVVYNNRLHTITLSIFATANRSTRPPLIMPSWIIGNRCVKASVDSYQGTLRVHVRHYYVDRTTGAHIPTKKGVALTLAEWGDLRKLQPDIDNEIKAQQSHLLSTSSPAPTNPAFQQDPLGGPG